MNVPFVDLKSQYVSIKDEIDAAISEIISNTAFIGGEAVSSFEKNFAELYGVKHCVSAANGTDSLYIIMKMLGIGEGDEVITSANSWISSSETITQTGATPVFADIESEYYTIDPEAVEKRISDRTKAILPVHLYGQMCDMETLNTLAKKYDLFVIEDCAQSHFSEFKGVRAGLVGIAGSFSFYPGKNLGAYGDAGAIITNDDKLAEKCRMYARHGALVKHKHYMEGINSRMDGIQAAVLNVKLKYILDWTDKRIENAGLYNENLKNISEITLPTIRPDSKHTFHIYVIRAQNRESLSDYLYEKGIQTALHYPTILPLLPAYEYLNKTPKDFPEAYLAQQEILSLPMYPELGGKEIDYIVKIIKTFYS